MMDIADTITLPRAEYEAMIERLEDFEDMQALARSETVDRNRSLPLASVRRILANEHPLRVWREHRGLTGQQLEALSGVPQSYISTIERDVKTGSTGTLQKLAKALSIAIDDIVRD